MLLLLLLLLFLLTLLPLLLLRISFNLPNSRIILLGEQLSAVNVASGLKQKQVLLSEAAKIDRMNTAEGDARAIVLKAAATSEAINTISNTIKMNDNNEIADNKNSGEEAIRLMLAEQYIHAFSLLAKESNTIVLNGNNSNSGINGSGNGGINDVAGMIATAMNIYNNQPTKKLPKNVLNTDNNDNNHNNIIRDYEYDDNNKKT